MNSSEYIEKAQDKILDHSIYYLIGISFKDFHISVKYGIITLPP